MRRRTFLAGAAAALAALPALAQEPATRVEIVRFRRGATSATIRGSINGYETVDYVVGARRGQRMRVSLSATRGSTYYLVMMPDGGDPLWDSSGGQDYSGRLPMNGDFAVRVYNFRNEARRMRRSDYSLTISITG